MKRKSLQRGFPSQISQNQDECILSVVKNYKRVRIVPGIVSRPGYHSLDF